MLKLNNQGYDQIDKYESVERASSVGFAFYMGRKCSAQIDPQVIVYHYQSGQYRWGISVNGEDHAKHIIEIKESHDEDA